MTIKDWLNRGYRINTEIDQLERAKQEMLDLVTRTTPTYGAQSTSGSKNPHKYDAYAHFCSVIDKRIGELVDIREEIIALIATVPNSVWRSVLTARYVRFLTWEQIAEEVNYSRQNVLTIHSRALCWLAQNVLKT